MTPSSSLPTAWSKISNLSIKASSFLVSGLFIFLIITLTTINLIRRYKKFFQLKTKIIFKVIGCFIPTTTTKKKQTTERERLSSNLIRINRKKIHVFLKVNFEKKKEKTNKLETGRQSIEISAVVAATASKKKKLKLPPLLL